MESLIPEGRIAHVEVIYEGDHSPPSVYMVEVVEKVAQKFGDQLRWEKVELATRKGVQRFAKLSVINGGVPPIPSLFINERLAFSTAPSLLTLEEYLKKSLT
jgi:hypothetical protein